jgi:hypothetical protein
LKAEAAAKKAAEEKDKKEVDPPAGDSEKDKE